jgi:hypothetical protein
MFFQSQIFERFIFVEWHFPNKSRVCQLLKTQITQDFLVNNINSELNDNFSEDFLRYYTFL